MAHSRGVCYPSFHYFPFLLYLLLLLNCRGKTAPRAITSQKTSLSFHKVLNLTSEPLALLSTVCCAQTGTILVLRDSQVPRCERVGVKERDIVILLNTSIVLSLLPHISRDPPPPHTHTLE